MKQQYSVRALVENLLSGQSKVQLTAQLISAMQSVDEISNLEDLETKNNHLIRLSFYSDSSFNILQSKLQLISEQLEIDLILKNWSERKMTPGLLIMDMDSTLVQAETIDQIAAVAGVGEKVAEITESAMRGELDFTESLNARVSMLEGILIDDLDAVHDCLPLTGGAVNLLKKAQENGCHTALVSGGFTMFAGPIAEKLGFDTLSANTLGIEDNRLTGRVVGDIVDGQSKLQTLNRLRDKLGLTSQQIVAIGDGANDLPMLSAAGTGIAFHAKPKVQQQATTILNYNDLNAVCWLLDW